MTAPPLVMSMGDPAGIGLEIAGKAWASRSVPPFCLLGDEAAAAALCGAPTARIARLAEAAEVFPEAMPVLHRGLNAPVTPGRPDTAHAPAILAAIEQGVALCRAGEAAALVTLPIAKKPLYEAGFRFPGQTEFVAALVEDAPFEHPWGPVMMLAGPSLRVALATIHLPLRAAADALSVDRIARVGRVTAFALRRDFGLASPRMAVCGLNPHAGEGGALGGEEREVIAPAIDQLRAEGLAVAGPLPADAMFHEDARARYDAAIAMYHDQGLIPLKMLHFWDAVNVTLGLPVVRTSPDHGTGFDIAGQNRARADSLIAALRMAQAIAARRRGDAPAA